MNPVRRLYPAVETGLPKSVIAPSQPELAKMTIVVKGIDTRDSNSRPYIRQDIDKWYADQIENKKRNRIQLTLFVEALALIQERPLENELSYFRLAAIHAAPWCEWNGVQQPSVIDPNGLAGYCVHNNYTFPTWHRVYILLYEVGKNCLTVGENVQQMDG